MNYFRLPHPDDLPPEFYADLLPDDDLPPVVVGDDEHRLSKECWCRPIDDGQLLKHNEFAP